MRTIDIHYIGHINLIPVRKASHRARTHATAPLWLGVTGNFWRCIECGRPTGNYMRFVCEKCADPNGGDGLDD
jgi:hypothetical protein